MKEIQPTELKAMLDRGEKVVLLDVRQPDEHELVRINDSLLIPLMELPGRTDEIRAMLQAPHDAFVVYCRAGGRSAKALEFLSQEGITGLNLRGGINAYAQEADTTLTPY